jgi:hypothetical protein
MLWVYLKLETRSLWLENCLLGREDEDHHLKKINIYIPASMT